MASIRNDLYFQGIGRLDNESVPVCQVKYTVYQVTQKDRYPVLHGLISIRKNDPFKTEFLRSIGNGAHLTLVLERSLEDGRPCIPINVVRLVEDLSDEEFLVYEIVETPWLDL